MHRYLILFSIGLFFPLQVFAASVFLSGPTHAPAVGDTFSIGVSLDTGSETINAIEGSVHIPASLTLSAIRFDGSLVPLWVVSPHETAPGVISFAGVLPGGYSGTPPKNADQNGTLFTLVVQTQKKGTAAVVVGSDTVVYRDDGNGTKIATTHAPLALTIVPSSGAPHSAALAADLTPPSLFAPSIVSAEVFGMSGRALVVTAQDKNSGVAAYEIARSYNAHAKEPSLLWKKIESPYFLIDGDSTHYLYVRATDAAGNTRVVTLPPHEFSIGAFFYQWWMLIGILLGMCAILFLRRMRT